MPTTDPPTVEFQIKLDNINVAPDSRIVLEAFRGNTFKRFELGTKGAYSYPVDRRLTNIDLSGPVSFNLLFIEMNGGSPGKILASALKIKPGSKNRETGKDSLMHIQPFPLGEKIWELEIEEYRIPILKVNSLVPEAVDRMKDDPIYHALVLPAFVQEVLTHYWLSDPEADSPGGKWIDFGIALAGPIPGPNEYDGFQVWIKEVCSEFCSKHALATSLARKDGK